MSHPIQPDTSTSIKLNPTVYVQNIPVSATTKQLQDHFSQFGPVRQCFVVLDPSKPGKNRGFGFVHFAIPDDAVSAISKAGSVKFLNLSNLTVQPAKPRQALDDRQSSKKRSHTSASDSQAILPHLKKPKITSLTTARLIVRNLSFKCTPTILKTVFAKFGNVSETLMPRKYMPDGPYRGFGIVQFTKRSDAERAIGAMNEQTVCDRIVAVDWCLPQAQFLIGEGADADKVQQELTDKFVAKRKMKEAMLLVHDNTDSPSDPVTLTESKTSGDKCEDHLDTDVLVQPVKTLTHSKNTSMPEISAGTTVFVRNVPFEVSEDELYTLFSTFGDLVYVRITCDRDTRKSKGTAFVCYVSRTSADACLAEGTKMNHLAYAMTTTSSSTASESIEHIPVSSLLTPEVPTALLGSTLVLNGRVLNVTRAVDRELASTYTAKEKQRRARKDKRNTYLLDEGYQGASKLDRVKEMESNLALYVSETRIAFRNIPLYVTEKDLKAFASASARVYLDQVVSVGNDLAWPIGDQEITERNFMAEAAQVRPTVKQAKIVRSKDRLDPSTGQLRSKGFGFVEFYEHTSALACVRSLADPGLDRAMELTRKYLMPKIKCTTDENGVKVLDNEIKDNKVRMTGKVPEVIVEFALENKQVVNLRAAKIHRVQAQPKRAANGPKSTTSHFRAGRSSDCKDGSSRGRRGSSSCGLGLSRVSCRGGVNKSRRGISARHSLHGRRGNDSRGRLTTF